MVHGTAPPQFFLSNRAIESRSHLTIPGAPRVMLDEVALFPLAGQHGQRGGAVKGLHVLLPHNTNLPTRRQGDRG